jgi:hypothetical protein
MSWVALAILLSINLMIFKFLLRQASLVSGMQFLVSFALF